MPSGFVLGPGQGPAYGFHGSVAVIKASGEDTFGQLGVIESVYPAGLTGRLRAGWPVAPAWACQCCCAPNGLL